MAADTPVSLLRAHARYAPWNARGLAAHAASLAEAAGVRPTNTSARATPSARAIRFYVAQGLLDRPEGAGTAATYGYRHLIQLLAIKIRQREGQTLDTIKQELREVTGDALERRVAQALQPALTLDGNTPHRVPNETPTAWRRVVVADGIEVSVREGTAAARDHVLLAIREAVRGAITRSDDSA